MHLVHSQNDIYFGIKGWAMVLEWKLYFLLELLTWTYERSPFLFLFSFNYACDFKFMILCHTCRLLTLDLITIAAMDI
jgi:hypothetical protein